MAASLPIWKERKEGGKGVMRQIDAVLLDIDGTLVPAGRYGVSAPVVKRVDEIRRQGVKVIVATGRSGFVMGPRLLGAFEADYYICSNGGEVLNAEKQRIYERRFTAEQVERLTAHSDPAACPAQAPVLLSADRPHNRYKRHTHPQRRKRGRVRPHHSAR